MYIGRTVGQRQTPSEQAEPSATTPRTSPSSRASRRCASGPACTSAPPACAACTTSSTRSSTTRSTRRSPGTATRSTVTIHPDNSVTVVDDGRGIPVAIMEKEGKPAVEVVLTVLHAGGKFGDGGGYKVSGGLHGVGVSVVNALSERLHVEVRRDGYVWTQDYERGKPQGRLRAGRADGARPAPRSRSCRTPRSSRRSTSTSRRSSSACARPRSSRAACGSRSPTSAARAEHVEFHYEGGIEDFVAYLQREQGPDPEKIVFFEGETRRGRGRGRDAVELLLPGVGLLVRQQHQHARGRLAPLRLPLRAHAHAQHATRARRACSRRRTTTSPARTCARASPRSSRPSSADPQFEGQTKTKLGNPGMQGFVESVVNRGLGRVPRGEPAGGARRSSRKAVSAAQARDAARKARDLTRRKSALENSRAAGQARRLLGARTRRWPRSSSSRATPPAARPSRAATARRRRCCRCAARSSTSRRRASTRCSQNNEIQALITAIGTGMRDEFDIEKARYHKIILMTDADVDGAHIRTLVADAAVPRDAGADRGRLRLHRQAAALQAQAGQAASATSRRSRELEEILLADKLERFEIFDRSGNASSSSPRRAGSATRGCSSSTRAGRRALRAEHGHDVVDFLEESEHPRRGGHRRGEADRAAAARRRPDGAPYTTELVSRGPGRARRALGRAREPASRARTACAARCSRRTSTASSCASTRSSSRWSARRRSTSRSASTATRRCRSRSCAAS